MQEPQRYYLLVGDENNWKIAIKENITKLYTIDAHSLLILCDNNLYLINIPEEI